MRTVVSRLLLVGLLAVAVVAVIRLSSGSAGRGVVPFGGLDPDRLRHEAFSVSEPATFAVDAVGSFEEVGTPESDTTLAAYGWIVRRDDGAVVWRMRPARDGSATLAAVQDTVRLAPGVYDAYFASLGDPLVRPEGPRDGSLSERVRSFLSRGGRSWVGDAGRWRFEIEPLDRAARRARTSGFTLDPADVEPAAPLLVWQAQGVRNRQRREALVQVTAPARVRLRAVTEVVDGAVADRASLVRLGTRDTVWTAEGPGAPVGGSLKNRAVEAEVALEPGIYRAAFETDRSHAYGDWSANPPWVPSAWGLRVTRATPDAAVARLDPTALDLPEIVAFECVGPDERRRAELTLTEPTDVLLVAVGEAESGSEYDYATLERREDDGGWDEVWEMEDDGDLEWAGGADKNRRAVQAFSLDPGTYRLTVETDRSHDCQSGYNSGGGPTDPFWGAALYALDPDADVSAIAVDVSQDVDRDRRASVEAQVLRFPTNAQLIARIDSVGDDEDRRIRFDLAEPMTVTVVAAGEISSGERYDYATIERPNGERVWTMTRDNTASGGDRDFHRVFSGPVDLDVGTYVLRYRSDSSSSFGDFGPDSEVLWGVHVYRPNGAVLAPVPPTADSVGAKPVPPVQNVSGPGPAPPATRSG